MRPNFPLIFTTPESIILSRHEAIVSILISVMRRTRTPTNNLIESIDVFLNEFINKEVNWLKKYLELPEDAKLEDIAENFSFFAQGFINHYPDVANEIMEKEGISEDDLQDWEGYEIFEYIRSELKEYFDDLKNYIVQHVMNSPEFSRELPSHQYFDKPEIFKNNWLIHFTDDAIAIAYDGFQYGVDDYERLGLTTDYSKADKKTGGKGYSFAYDVNDFKRYYYNRSPSEPKYGSEAVLFRASGIKSWHDGDGEPQVIFYGETAKDFIPITQGENDRWGVYSTKTGKLLREDDDLGELVDWILYNFAQYRKSLVY